MRFRRYRFGMRLIAASALLFGANAQAHKPSDSYLNLHAESGQNDLHGQWDVALRDLDLLLTLDANADNQITWGELSPREKEIEVYAFAHLQISADDVACPITATEFLVDSHSDGMYAVLKFSAHCAAPPKSLSVHYGLLFDLDPSHRGLLNLSAGAITQSAVFAPEQAEITFDLAASSLWRQLLQYIVEGIWHIWLGFDHILFLISLLLPAVLIREREHWIAAPRLGAAVGHVIGVVTAFTVAHSLTLSLAVLGVISLPSRLVESLIAFSVVLAALNNVWPLVTRRAWLIAFFFGLIHGFGFASALNDLGLPKQALVLSLFGFNVGVEIGQLAIVSVVVPLAFLLRRTGFYRRGVLVAGSLLIALVALGWLIERAFNISLFAQL